MSYGGGGVDVEETLAALQQQQDDDYSDDDNAQQELQEPDEDPLLLAVDDLEGRVVTTLDDVQSHPGTRADPQVSIHEELGTLLRPVLEVAAHTGPSIARTYYRGGTDIDVAVNDVYDRIVSDLVLPTLLEIARGPSPTKRAAALEILKLLYAEWHQSGSWLNNPYGTGHVSHFVAKQRQDQKRARESELLRYWVQASIACTTPGTFTNEQADAATAARGIIAASASLRPSLRHIVVRIKDADDRGANQVYKPVMKMVEGVIRKLVDKPTEAVLSACIKFLEIVILCCSRKPQEATRRVQRGRGRTNNSQDFSLDDLPEGHPVITRPALESVAEYAFTTLRGFTLLGGQVKVDASVSSTAGTLPSAHVVNLLKPAALAYLEVESALNAGESTVDVQLDRSKLEFEFKLAQKSYALTVNAMSALAMNRPVFFKESAICLARRTVSPPEPDDDIGLKASAAKAVASQLRAACLTLLRNSLSIPAGASDTLREALVRAKMEQQADKALGMAKQAHRLKTAGRAERNRANMHYEWETSVNIKSDLADIRKRKAARGLGNGIQLPTNMTEAIELVMINLQHLPAERPDGKPNDNRMTLTSLMDAILTNGASLSQEEGRWYERDGGSSTWVIDKENLSFAAKDDFLDTLRDATQSKDDAEDEPTSKRRKLLVKQCGMAAADAFGRIVATSSSHRNKAVEDFGNRIAARLAFTLNHVQSRDEEAQLGAQEAASKSDVDKEHLEKFVADYPLASACLALGSSKIDYSPAGADSSLVERTLMESLLEKASDEGDDTQCYDKALGLFVASATRACAWAQEKPGDKDRQNQAVQSMDLVEKCLLRLPRLTPEAIRMLCGVCNVELISRKNSEAARKQTSDEQIAVSAAIHAAKMAAEKRATSVLLLLRDTAFQRDGDARKVAVDCVVDIAAGRLPSNPSIQDKAVKLSINILFAKNSTLASDVCDAATKAVEWASAHAVEKYEAITEANKIAEAKNTSLLSNPMIPHSDVEKAAIDLMRKPVILYMALCIRKPALIEKLFQFSCVEKADVLSKTVRSSMTKLARAVATKHGAASIAMDVASMTSNEEVPMLLSFLDNLSPMPDEELIQACNNIQDLKSGNDGEKDPRFVIPVVASMKRADLVERLPEFMQADDKVFLAALVHSGKRVGRHALIFRDEPDEEVPSLHGMTLCEQLVFLHKIDLVAAGIPQKRCLAAITLCLNDDAVYNDRVVLAALDYISGTFLSGQEKLPLPFMRTCIQVFALHETVHSWFASDLLPRLVDGKIYEDARLWEGWMRCTRMLEETKESGVNANAALSRLPPEQLMLYKTKWAGR